MKIKKKLKHPRTCYYCKYSIKQCKDKFRVETCDRFKFHSIFKSA